MMWTVFIFSYAYFFTNLSMIMEIKNKRADAEYSVDLLRYVVILVLFDHICVTDNRRN